MKKMIIVAIAATMVLALQAQTVSTAAMQITYCSPTENSSLITEICNTELPYTWKTTHGDIIVTEDDIVDGHIIMHKEFERTGAAPCMDEYDMNLTVKTCIPTGAINGLFSVASGKQIYFSKGNLQFTPYQDDGSTDATHTGYRPTTKETVPNMRGRWRFAEKQWDLIVYEEEEGYTKSLKSLNSAGWFDIFNWGYSGLKLYNAAEEEFTAEPVIFKVPANSNMKVWHWHDGDADYGLVNPIENGGNQPGLWRVISQEEWQYLLQTRTNAASLRARATVNGYYGLVILPDNWKWGSGQTGDIPASWDYTSFKYDNNTYTGTVWTAMENAGAVFLPCRGSVNSSTTNPGELTGSSRIEYITSTQMQATSFNACPVITVMNYSESSYPDKATRFPVRLISDYIAQ